MQYARATGSASRKSFKKSTNQTTMKTTLLRYFPVILLFSFILWMVVSADTNQSNIIMDLGHSVPMGDKIGHFILFGILALLLNVSLSFRQIKIHKRRFHLGSIVVLVFAIAEECSQLGFSSRTFDFVDMLFDLLGIGLLSSVAFRRALIKKLREGTDRLSDCLLVD